MSHRTSCTCTLAGVSRRLAVLYDKQGDHSRAAVEYRTALQQAPHDADLLCDFGYFHYERGDHAEAEREFRAALKENPQHQKAWVNLGLTLGRQGREAESIEAFTTWQFCARIFLAAEFALALIIIGEEYPTRWRGFGKRGSLTS